MILRPICFIVVSEKLGILKDIDDEDSEENSNYCELREQT